MGHRNRVRLGQGGAALAEMAIMLPFLMLLLLGVIDFCRVFYAAVAVTQAARAGTQYGARNATIGDTALYNGMIQAAANVVQGYGLTLAVPPVPQRYCLCPGGTPPTCPAAGGSACPPLGCPTDYQIYICTSTSYTFSTFAPYPGIPNTVNLTRAAVMRVQ